MKQTPKFVTKLFAAIDGYADIKAENEQQALNLSQVARDTIKPVIEQHNGVWMYEKNGEIYANFKLPEDAVKCAVALQRKMSGHPDVKLRIGIHTGDIKSGIGTGDIVASKIAGSASLRGICISGKVYASIQNTTDVTAEYFEDVKPAGVEHPVSVYALAGEGLNEPVITSSVKEPSTKKPQPSIVVLPFDDISPGKDNEYFSDGLTEEIITDLSLIHNLLVISRNSAMTFKGTKKKTKEIAREVNVQYVLEGSIRKVGNNLRITAQLIDASNDTHLWAEKYSGTLDDVFDIQEKVSRSIVDSLKLKLSPEEDKKIAEQPIDNVQAYECYLRARQEIWRLTEESLDRALQLLQNGLDIIGENALLYSGIGYVYYQYVNMGFKQEDYISKAEDYIKRVLELEPESSQGHFLIGLINGAFRGNQKQSIHHFKLALATNPNDSEVLLWLMSGYMLVGKTSAAGPLVERILKINPLNPVNYCFIAVLHCYGGEFDLALERANKSIQMEPENTAFKFIYALILAYNQRFDEAFSIIEKMVKTAPEYTWTQWGLFLKYALNHERNKISELFTRELQNTAERDPQYSSFVASFYSLLGQKEEALNWLENAVNQGFINYPFLNEYDPFLENIRGEERFKKLMERVKYEWENFKV